MKTLNDKEKVILNEAMFLLRELENNKKNKTSLEKAEKAITELKENLGLSHDDIHQYYYKFRVEILMNNQAYENQYDMTSSVLLKRKVTYDY